MILAKLNYTEIKHDNHKLKITLFAFSLNSITLCCKSNNAKEI